MSLPTRAILILCLLGYANAQYPEVEIRTGLTGKAAHRYQNNNKQQQQVIPNSRSGISGARQVHHLIGPGGAAARPRRPIPPLISSRGAAALRIQGAAGAGAASSIISNEPGPDLLAHGISNKPLSSVGIKPAVDLSGLQEKLIKPSPGGVHERIQNKQQHQTQVHQQEVTLLTNNKQEELHQQHQENKQQQQQQSIKPVSEETEEDVAQAIANLGAVSSFGPHQHESSTGNLVGGGLTPKPDLGLSQFRGGSPLLNIAPVQYRPPHNHINNKGYKLRNNKLIIEQVDGEVQRITGSGPRNNQQLSEPTPASGIVVRSQKKASSHSERHHHQQQQQQQTNAETRSSHHQHIPSPPPPNNNNNKYGKQEAAINRDKFLGSSGSREKKPVAQIIRRWREDNPDGSITWGFENDDGSYKEELIGIDCITRGKYGYIDLDGFRREYTYETGIKCDEEEQEDERENGGFVDYQENKLVLPNGKTIDLSSMGKKQARRPQPISYPN